MPYIPDGDPASRECRYVGNGMSKRRLPGFFGASGIAPDLIGSGTGGFVRHCMGAVCQNIVEVKGLLAALRLFAPGWGRWWVSMRLLLLVVEWAALDTAGLVQSVDGRKQRPGAEISAI